MMWIVLLLCICLLGLSAWTARQHFSARAIANHNRALTIALSTVAGACYRLLNGQAYRLDLGEADRWPPNLGIFLTQLSPDYADALGRAIYSLELEGQPFVLSCAWQPMPTSMISQAEFTGQPGVDGQYEIRRIEISGHRLPDVCGGGLAEKTGSIDLVWVNDVTQRAVLDEERLQNLADLARFRTAFQSLPLPMWWRDHEQTVHGGNRPIEELRTIALPSTDLARQAFASGLSTRRRSRIQAGSGESHSVDIIEVPQPGGTLGFAIDRGEFEDAQTELERLRRGFREVLEGVTTGIAIFGPDTRLIFFNAAFLDLWGITAAKLANEPSLAQVLEVLHEERVLPEYADFRRFKAEEMALFSRLRDPREELLHLPDERTIRLKVTRHTFGGLTFFYDDVSDKLTLERSYNTLRDVQHETLENLHEAIAVFGSDGRIKLWNPSFIQSWSLRPEFLEERPHILSIAEVARNLLANELPWEQRREQFAALVIGQQEYNGRLNRADGRSFEMSVLSLPDGNVLWTLLDSTDALRVQRALQERNEALEASSRLKSEFIANVSYELRTPLNAIIGFAEILVNEYFGELNERQKEYGRGILEGSSRLLALIDDILDLATIEAGHMALERVSADIHALLSAVLALARERAGRLELTLALDCPKDIGSVFLDQRRIRQALFNLVSNAIKFTPSGGSITLSARRTSKELVMGVIDTGIGIAAEDQARVFEKFERGDRKARQVGAGLGLALVKSFVELHGGEVELQSEPGTGTHVTLRIPIIPAEEQKQGEAKRRPEPPVSSNTRNAELPLDV